MNISSYIEFLKLNISEVEPLLKKIVKENESTILKLIRTRLYQKSIDGDGNQITPDYELSTVEYKKSVNQISNRVTLRDSGSFYANMYVNYSNGFISVDSLVSYSDDLTEKYGDSILELTNDEISFVINSIIEPELLKRMNLSQQIVIDF